MFFIYVKFIIFYFIIINKCQNILLQWFLQILYSVIFNKIKYLETQLLFTQNSLSELQNKLQSNNRIISELKHKLSDIENEYSLKTSALIESTVDLNVKLQDYISHNYEVI